MTGTTGVIFATTGKDYTELAARAAQSVRDKCPGLEIDLFTDQTTNIPVFDRIHHLDDPWHRSKMDAMILSRFDKTLYLDADLFVVADIRDVFEVLDRFDMAMAQDSSRNGDHAQTMWRKPLPNAFPQFNGGVIAYKATPEVISLLQNWSATVRDNGFESDQPVFRELLWYSDLRLATLPREYNLMRYWLLRRWRTRDAAPRILHSPRLHKHFTKNKRRVESLEDLVGPVTASKLPSLFSADRSLARMAGRQPHFPSRKETWLRQLRLIRDLPLFWVRRLFLK